MSWAQFQKWMDFNFDDITLLDLRRARAIFETRGAEPAARWLLGQCDNCHAGVFDHIDSKCPFAPTKWKEVEA